MIEYIPQSGAAPDAGIQPISLFGKQLNLAPVCDTRRIMVHQDFPLIDESDVDHFAASTQNSGKVVITGCPVKVNIHPYRLIEIKSGACRFLLDIPPRIRGHRQSYPEIYRFVPALIAIPPGVCLGWAPKPEWLVMHIMHPEKLLDQSVFFESLFIKAILQNQERP